MVANLSMAFFPIEIHMAIKAATVLSVSSELYKPLDLQTVTQ